MQVSVPPPYKPLPNKLTKRQAIIDATFQDDMYNEAGDPSVNALQDHIAAITGKEAGLWVLSGTMGNQICLRTHLTQPPHSVLLDARAHVHNWESGALPVLSQASATQVYPKNGVYLTVDDVRKNIIADGNSAFPSLQGQIWISFSDSVQSTFHLPASSRSKTPSAGQFSPSNTQSKSPSSCATSPSPKALSQSPCTSTAHGCSTALPPKELISKSTARILIP